MGEIKEQFKNKNLSRGFTLVELLVAITLFMIIMDITVSVFVSMVQHQKRILVEQEFLSQTSYAMEAMSKSLRLAVKDSTGECLFEDGDVYPGYVYFLTRFNIEKNASEGIKFVADDGVCQEYFLDKDGILKESKDGKTPQAILSSRFVVKDFTFIINGDKNRLGALGKDQVQPRVTIMLKVGMQVGNIQQEKVIQTTVSQLDLNI
ncbi:MAG: prepilin-type N-terminal cleavage/methylation domain-containing protein [Candidatus Staskawiczbacteria bacterium]|nr:prepilin-type N-terminal cleavage/methylation domain-containing protein [Candidatus Staskawiczbacteria bacterium]